MFRPSSSAILLSLALAIPASGDAQTYAPAGLDPVTSAPEMPDGSTETPFPAPVESAPVVTLDILSAADVTLEQFLWTNRVLVIFADTPADPRFIKQMQIIEQWPRDLSDRDVVVVIDTDPANGSAVRKTLRPRGFSLVLVDKDGTVKLRKPSPWHSREIARSIDRTPLRQDEIRERIDDQSAG